MKHTALSAIALLSLFIMGCSTTAGPETRLSADGRFQPCPKSPNCVSSMAETRDAHFIEPIRLKDGSKTSWQAVLDVLKQWPRTQIVEHTGDFVHAECHTPSRIFTDDLVLLRSGDQVHIRSSSRIGHYDFNANRKRVNALREAVSESPSATHTP